MQLTKKHLGLIEWQLSRFKDVDPRFHDDLRSAGNLGLLQGLRTWNPEGDTQFETYATQCIYNAMRNERRMINANKIQNTMIADGGVIEETASEKGMSAEEAILLEEKWKEGWNRLMDILPELSYRQKFILMHRIHCADEDELTQAEVASRFKCNQSTIQREETKLYEKLARYGTGIGNDSEM